MTNFKLLFIAIFLVLEYEAFAEDLVVLVLPKPSGIALSLAEQGDQQAKSQLIKKIILILRGALDDRGQSIFFAGGSAMTSEASSRGELLREMQSFQELTSLFAEGAEILNSNVGKTKADKIEKESPQGF